MLHTDNAPIKLVTPSELCWKYIRLMWAHRGTPSIRRCIRKQIHRIRHGSNASGASSLPEYRELLKAHT